VVQRLVADEQRFGSFAVNASGGLFFGYVWVLAEDRSFISGEIRFLILIPESSMPGSTNYDQKMKRS